MNPARQLGVVARLTKFRISLLGTLTAVAGYLLFAEHFERELWVTVAGVYLLASGACALNEVQERDIDARMNRTRGRPLPAGEIGLPVAVAIAVSCLALGAVVLFRFGGPTPVALGLLAAFWYNGVYTPLKRRTAFAVLPGALIGALPPAIGWTMAGGGLKSPVIVSLSVFFFIWQVPHFWLLLLNFGQQYSDAGLPSLTDRLSPDQLVRIVYVWMVATAVTCLLMPAVGATDHALTGWLLALAGAWLAGDSARWLKPGDARGFFRVGFRNINLYALIVIGLLSIDKLTFG